MMFVLAMESSRIERRLCASPLTTDFGGHSGGVTPVPIPNTEVKPASADGTWEETPWESRTPPDFSERAPTSVGARSRFRRRWPCSVVSSCLPPRRAVDNGPGKRASGGRCGPSRATEAAGTPGAGRQAAARGSTEVELCWHRLVDAATVGVTDDQRAPSHADARAALGRTAGRAQISRRRWGGGGAEGSVQAGAARRSRPPSAAGVSIQGPCGAAGERGRGVGAGTQGDDGRLERRPGCRARGATSGCSRASPARRATRCVAVGRTPGRRPHRVDATAGQGVGHGGRGKAEGVAGSPTRCRPGAGRRAFARPWDRAGPAARAAAAGRHPGGSPRALRGCSARSSARSPRRHRGAPRCGSCSGVCAYRRRSVARGGQGARGVPRADRIDRAAPGAGRQLPGPGPLRPRCRRSGTSCARPRRAPSSSPRAGSSPPVRSPTRAAWTTRSGCSRPGARRCKRPRDRHLRMAYAIADLHERAGDVPRAREQFAWIRSQDPDFADVGDRLAGLD